MKGALVLLLVSVCSVYGQTVNYRLPTTVLPSNYNIQITPYFTAEAGKELFTFDGIATIRLSTTQMDVAIIELHALNLPGQNPTLVEALAPTIAIIVSGMIDDPVSQKRTLTLTTPLRPNIEYLLTFNYVGYLNEEMNGFYRSYYVENGVTKWVGTTQMQPVHARKVFPCFDEPSFKATFDITINRISTWSESISNTRIIASNIVNGRTREIFRTTPIMSTYLVAFIVSEFQVRENTARTFGIIARPDAYEQTVYAFNIGQTLLSRLDQWTAYAHNEVPAIEKMHMAALPDFSAGAMENWGLLTYRETNQLYDSELTTALQQQRIAAVITHEQAHLWFGDLVTCEWWGHTWLNEGFARYFQYFGTGLVETTWDLGAQFVVEQIQGVMGQDSLENVHAMSFTVNSPAEISVAFDSISYNKGASVLRMIEHLMGPNNFQAALRAYLRLHQFRNVLPSDLFTALQLQATNLNIANIMETWTTQPGYPVVTVERTGSLTYTISQRRFLLKNKDHTDATMWEIPLNYASPSQLESFATTTSRESLTKTQRTKQITVETDTEWKIFNVQQTGYYRVNYDNETWTAIGNALKAESHSNIHNINRAQIVDDILNLARAGIVDYWQALSVLQYIEKEENYIPWLSAFNNLLYISRRFTDAEMIKYKKHVLSLTKNIYEKLEFNPKATDTRTDIYNRANVLNYACKFGHEACINAAKEEFGKLQATASYRVPVNIRSVVYCTAISEGGETEWNFLWEKYRLENVATEQVIILAALGCSLDKTILERYMDRILTEAVRPQDKAAAFTATYNERVENVPLVFDYIRSKFVDVAAAWGGAGQVASILSNLAARFSSQEQIDELQTFYNANLNFFGASQTIPNAIADAKFNLDWAKEHVPVIINYFDVTAGSATLTVSLVLIFTTLLSLFY